MPLRALRPTEPAPLDPHTVVAPAAVDPSPKPACSDAELLARHAPTLVLDGRELFTPTEVDRYVEACSLVDRHGTQVAMPTLDMLDGRWSSGTSLRFVDDDARRSLDREQRRAAFRSASTTRLGRVGLVGRLVDALFQLSVRLRPVTPRHTTAAAYALGEQHGLQQHPVCYGRVVRTGEWLVLHYAYFYLMNDWRTSYRGLNDHEADWEQAWIFCDPADLSPQWIATSSHDESGGDRRRHWSDPELGVVEGHPRLFVGAGSHAMFYQPGDYVTRIDVPALRWLLRAQRWARRVLGLRADASERGSGPALGVPFIDAAGGDGEAIADWDIRSMNGEVWVHDFRGLWGEERGDPLNGERGPSGPKFERSGELRRSWVDPLGFAGLHGTPPPSARAARVNRQKLGKVLDALDEQIRHRARLLPLAEQTDTRDGVAAESEQLTRLLTQRAELEDVGRRLESGPWREPGIRDHLRHPAIPLDRSQSPGWFHALWSAMSVPLMLAALAAVLISDRIRLEAVALVVVVVMLPLEYITRREFGATARVLVLEAAMIAFFAFAFGVVISTGALALGICMLIAAVLLVVVNTNELSSVLASRRRRRR